MFLPYSLIMFLVSLGDAVMAYTAPVYMQLHLNNSPALMGLVFSSSSLVGLTCDFLLAKLFPGKSYAFYFWATVLFALIFPTTFMVLPPVVYTFLLGMAAWGIYYELIQFSNFHFLGKFLVKEKFAWGWGILDIAKSSAYFFGPLLAGYLIDLHTKLPFVGALAFFGLAGLGFGLVFSRNSSSKASDHHNPLPIRRTSVIHQLLAWKTLMGKIWPLYLFLLTLALVESAFWTIGIIFSESLNAESSLGRLLLPAYMLPSLFMGFLTTWAAKWAGKKRAGFVCGAISGGLLCLITLNFSLPWMLFIIFISSVFGALSWPLLFATFEDFTTRLGKSGDELIGLQRSAISLAYILGPVVAGLIASLVGSKNTFALFGLAQLIVTIVALLVVPRKIRLPQSELAELLS